jgi:archaellum component FlaC
MLPTPNRDLPEVVSELIIEMHEVRSELNGINGRLDRLERRMEGVETEIKLVREDNRQNTDRLIDAFSRSMAPLIERVLTHDERLNRLENPQA